MATFLDVTILENFSVIFVFLLVWIGGYAILNLTKAIGQNQFVLTLVSLVIAFFTILSPTAVLIFKSILPFIAVGLLVIVMIAAAGGMFGKMEMESLPGIKTLVIVVFVIALIVGIFSIVRGNIAVPERGEDFGKVSTVIFHPNFLGVILLFAIAVFAIGLLATKQS
ncbi:MAG: hypothetical protein V1831_03660 [Candidatus Woesearchaeota archaeon]